MGESASCAASLEPERAAPGRWRALWPLLLVVCACAGAWWGQRKDLAGAGASASTLWQPDLESATALARQQDKPLHVFFTSKSAALAARMDETLAAPPVAQLARLRFVNVRLDSVANAAEFRRYFGGAGVLGSCILDVAGGPDVLALLPGFAEPSRYALFLDSAANNLARTRELRARAAGSGVAALALAELYAEQGSGRRARAVLANVQEPVALRASALEHLARLDIEAGQVARARAQLSQAQGLANVVQSQRWLLTEGLVLSGERRVGAAVTWLAAGLPSLAPSAERGQVLLLLGSLEHELKRDAEALAHLALIGRELPGSALAALAEERSGHIRRPQPGHTH